MLQRNGANGHIQDENCHYRMFTQTAHNIVYCCLLLTNMEFTAMYGKLFAQMYDGTLATRGPWQAMVTFQQLIILADKDGIVDMTREAIARRTTIPLEIVNIGITALEQPDSESRTPAEDGRRIVKLSPDRDWGWRIVNHAHYRKIRSQEERREYMRTYQANRRKTLKELVNTKVNNVSEINQLQYAGSSIQKAVDVGMDASKLDPANVNPIYEKTSQNPNTNPSAVGEIAGTLADTLRPNRRQESDPDEIAKRKRIAELVAIGHTDEAAEVRATLKDQTRTA